MFVSGFIRNFGYIPNEGVDMIKFYNMNTLPFQDFRLSTASPSALAQAIDNPFKKFAASRMANPRASGILATVSFRTYTGKVYNIACRNKSQINAARKFFDVMRVEHMKLREILAEYPVVLGMIPVKFHSEIRKVLKSVFNIRKAEADLIIENGI